MRRSGEELRRREKRCRELSRIEKRLGKSRSDENRSEGGLARKLGMS